MTRYAPLWLQSGSYAASVDRRLIGAVWPAGASSGCAVGAGSGMAVTVQPGTCAVPTANNTGSVLCASDAVETVNLNPAPASGTNRIDLIICRPRGNDLDGGVNNDFIFDFVAGAEAASPVAPATPAGTLALAQVYVGGGVASIVAGNITDKRPGALAMPSIPSPLVAFRVDAGAAQSIPAGTEATLVGSAWAAPAHNYGGGTWNAPTGEFTIPARGLYRITACVVFGLFTAFTTPSVPFGGRIYVNGVKQFVAVYNVSNVNAGTDNGATLSKTLLLNAGDKITLRANNGHATINFGTRGDQSTYLCVDQIPIAA